MTNGAAHGADRYARWTGISIGLVIGISIALRLSPPQTPAPPGKPPTVAPASKSATPATTAVVALADRAERMIASINTRRAAADQASPEILHYKKMSPDELDAEIENVANETNDYTAENKYAPERHANLYRRVNVMFDIKGLSAKQNKWLAESVMALNDLSVRHAEDAWSEHDGLTTVRTAEALGEWGFRLNPPQKQRLTAVLTSVAAHTRAGE
jgi:hypothetical protein